MATKTTHSSPKEKDYLFIAAGLGGLYVLYQLVQGIKAIPKVAAGAVSGNNALTQGTPYQGAGLVATPAALADSASGGILSSFGSALGSNVFDTFNSGGIGSTLYYNTTFPDGSKHSIDSTTVRSDGTFTYQGQNYVMQTNLDGSHTALTTTDSSSSSGLLDFLGLSPDSILTWD